MLYLLKLSLKYIQHRLYISILIILSIAISLSVLVFVSSITFSITQSATDQGIRYPLIIGPENSGSTQLLLTTLFRIDKPSSLIEHSIYEDIKKDKDVIAAYPIALADNYQNIPIIGTNQPFIDQLGAIYIEQFGEKRLNLTENDLSYAYLGFEAAERTGLKPGDIFVGNHGMIKGENSHEHNELKYKVVAIMGKLNTPDDYAIFVHYKSVWLIHDRHLGNGLLKKFAKDKDIAKNYKNIDNKDGLKSADNRLKNIRENLKGDKKVDNFLKKKDKFMLTSGKITSILVKTSSPVATGRLERKYTMLPNVTAVDSSKTIRSVIKYLNKADKIASFFNIVTLAIVIIMVIIILIFTIDERKKELALMRVMGINQFKVSLTLLFEITILSLLGVIAGVILGHFAVWWAKELINFKFSINIDPFLFTSTEFLAIFVTLLATEIIGIAGMIAVYKTDLVQTIAKD